MIRISVLVGTLSLATLVLGAAGVVNAQVQVADPATLIATRMIAEGTVSKIDRKQRTMTLRLPSGEQVALKVAPEAREFDRIKKGDPIAVDYLEAISLSLQSASDLPETLVTAEQYHIAVPGNPAGALVNTEEVRAIVESVDPIALTVTLRAPDGSLLKLHVNPEAGSLDHIKPGDQMLARYTQALAVNVRKTRSGEKFNQTNPE